MYDTIMLLYFKQIFIYWHQIKKWLPERQMVARFYQTYTHVGEFINQGIALDERLN